MDLPPNPREAFPDDDGIPAKVGIAEGPGRGLMLRAAGNIWDPVAEGVRDEGEQFLVRAPRAHIAAAVRCGLLADH